MVLCKIMLNKSDEAKSILLQKKTLSINKEDYLIEALKCLADASKERSLNK